MTSDLGIKRRMATIESRAKPVGYGVENLGRYSAEDVKAILARRQSERAQEIKDTEAWCRGETR